ncbi:MAG: hypothetical protein WBL27_02950 [Salinimicrobium sp.]
MEKKAHNYRYIEWKSPDEMHFTSLQWKSELDFIKDEHHFFEDMLKEYTMPIIESKLFGRIKGLIERLSESKKELDALQAEVSEHMNRLQRLVENVDEPKEGRLYRQEHKKILQEINKFSKTYKTLKKEIFEAVSDALKQQKQKRLLA